MAPRDVSYSLYEGDVSVQQTHRCFFPTQKGRKGGLCTRTRARVPRECGIRADGEAASSLFRAVSRRPVALSTPKANRFESTMPLEPAPPLYRSSRSRTTPILHRLLLFTLLPPFASPAISRLLFRYYSGDPLLEEYPPFCLQRGGRWIEVSGQMSRTVD